MKRKIVLLIFVSILSLVACSIGKNIQQVLADNTCEAIGKKEQQRPERIEINISAVGDIMVHGPQLRAQYDKKSNAYNFKNNFEFIKPYISQSDIALCNLETTFAGENKGYSSFPKFNSPDALGEAIKDAGFDIIATANNHTIDKNAQGVYRTIDVLKKLSLDVVGTKENEIIPSYIIKEIKGVKVGITAYTYETPKFGKHKTLNSLIIPKEVENCINTFNYNEIDQELKKIEEITQNMKKDGVEIIIFYLHWGNEYQREPNDYQKKMAQALTDFGVDIIFGSHPHVIQPIAFMESREHQKKSIVVYSMGNFLSNQRYEILKNRYTEDGMIVNVTMEKNLKDDKITMKGVSYLPTWINKYYKNNKKIYEIVPLAEGLAFPEKYHLDKNSLWRAQNSKENTCNLIELGTAEIKRIPILKNDAMVK
ncbi:CapA family protein [Marinisporobacter balticus]|uniref:Poly-gamma-glutamate synthesis protein (Capsule biosynthesis protein) n=1 Tax=Marinisporobacter balticus TaxID=2018667 RepID=A0A4R2L1U1_9FIRM|nr:CapA family protein [Marinisporobacter balticus]TCO79167.1 poly-gamma-glutamate synthesis protein (capsule biosynthesis protein) [Marinisporobacter balticus]